jgi:hypothetical protein
MNKANSIMGLIRRTYTYLDEQSFKYLFQALVRPHIEYAEAVWSPFKVGDIEKIENVQRRATKQVPTLKNMEYNETKETQGYIFSHSAYLFLSSSSCYVPLCLKLCLFQTYPLLLEDHKYHLLF